MSKLSAAERAILINQYRIMGLIQGDENAYKNHIRVLSDGYELEYDDYIDGLHEPMHEDESKFVQDILWLYYLLKLAKNKEALENSGGDRDISGRLRFENFEPKFPGFDGNSEASYLSYANFLIHEEGKFNEHKHYLNAHGAHKNYHKMLEVWTSWGKPTDMTEAQADELLAL
ncbi:YfbU family protein [Ochrobactrum sp. SFR4]|uniref:YfbU family protein n=1 Tax=Ochrobactrum sp. SFR4 TaxID=2717368 RepID=UPI001C8B7C2A|nr:hypothetical protein [Ochrobactrum sp. SFR4]